MIKSTMIIEDENMFSLILEDVFVITGFCQLTPKIVETSDEGIEVYKGLLEKDKRPDLLLVDVNLSGSSFDGIEFIRKVNFELGNKVVIGVISTSSDESEIARAVKAGAQFWLIKTHDIEPRIEALKADFPLYLNRSKKFTIYDN